MRLLLHRGLNPRHSVNLEFHWCRPVNKLYLVLLWCLWSTRRHCVVPRGFGLYLFYARGFFHRGYRSLFFCVFFFVARSIVLARDFSFPVVVETACRVSRFFGNLVGSGAQFVHDDSIRVLRTSTHVCLACPICIVATVCWTRQPWVYRTVYCALQYNSYWRAQHVLWLRCNTSMADVSNIYCTLQ